MATFLSTAPQSTAAYLRIMTWNVAGKTIQEEGGLPTVFWTVTKYHPGVVALQEVNRNQAQRVEDVLKEELSGDFTLFFHATKYEKEDKTPHDDDRGIALLSKYPVLGQGGSEFNEQQEKDGEEERSFAFVLIKIGSSEPIRVITTHLTVHGNRDCESDKGGGVSVRTYQAREVFDFAAGLGSERSVVLGDFNAQKGTSPYEVAESRGFRDAFVMFRPKPIKFEGYTAGKFENRECPPDAECEPETQCAQNKRRIDHVFVGEAFSVRKVQNGPKPPSDHRSVIALLRFR